MLRLYHFTKIYDKTWGLQDQHMSRICDYPTYFQKDQADYCVEILKDKNLPALARQADFIGSPYTKNECSHNVYIAFDNEADEAEFILKYNDGIELETGGLI